MENVIQWLLKLVSIITDAYGIYEFHDFCCTVPYSPTSMARVQKMDGTAMDTFSEGQKWREAHSLGKQGRKIQRDKGQSSWSATSDNNDQM